MRLKIAFVGFCGLMIVMMNSCVAVQSQVRGDEAPQAVEDIIVADYPDRTEVTVVAEGPMIYAAFRLTNPERFIVDLAGTTLGFFNEKIHVDQGALISVLPIEGEMPNYVARLEIALAELVETNVRTEGNKLIIAIDKPTQEEVGEEPVEFEEVEEVTEIEPITPVPPTGIEVTEIEPVTSVPPTGVEVGEKEPVTPVPPTIIEEEGLPRAKVISEVVVEQDGEKLKVIISGDGELSPDVFMVGRDRLVVDLQDVTNAVRPNTIRIEHALAKRVRIGQHIDPKKVRVVLDLEKPIGYNVRTQDRQVILAIWQLSQPLPDSELTAAREPVAEQVPPPEIPEPVRPAVKPAPVKVPSVPATVPKFTGRKISLDFQNADLTTVLRLMADVSGLNIIIGAGVKGTVTIKVRNVPWDQALDIILKMNNLGQMREGNILEIDTLDNIARQRAQEAAVKDAGVRAEDLVTRIHPVNYADAEELAEPLQKSLSPRGSITIDKRTNTMIVKDVEKHLEEVIEMAKRLDTPTPQVLIEARIVQADRSFARSLGIMWGASFSDVSGTNTFGISGGTAGDFFTPTPGFAVNLPAAVSGLAADSTPGASFTFGRFTNNPINLDLRLSAGELSGLTKTISSPRIITLDNKTAKIEQGESIPFQTTSLQGTQTTFIDANLVLEVTPHVTADGSIMMKIKVARNALGSFSGPAGPSIAKREAITEVLLKDGETTVIGGIFVEERKDTETGIPWLSKIPIIGWLFKNVSETDTKNELLIFLTPTILKS